MKWTNGEFIIRNRSKMLDAISVYCRPLQQELPRKIISPHKFRKCTSNVRENSRAVEEYLRSEELGYKGIPPNSALHAI